MSTPVIDELAKQWLETSDLCVMQMNRAIETLKSHVRINKDLWDICQKEGIDMSELLDSKKH